jgi:hypothetical protein
MDKTLLAVILLFGAGSPRSAIAGEDEVVLALEPSYGLLSGDKAEHGAGGHASAWVGISETLWLAGSGGALAFFEDGHERLVYEALGGIVAALDVLRTIPFAEALIGVVATKDALVPTFRAGVGADYLFSKQASIGVAIRYRPLTEAIASDGLLTVQLRFGLRLEL